MMIGETGIKMITIENLKEMGFTLEFESNFIKKLVHKNEGSRDFSKNICLLVSTKEDKIERINITVGGYLQEQWISLDGLKTIEDVKILIKFIEGD
jgi:hypothetical protein